MTAWGRGSWGRGPGLQGSAPGGASPVIPSLHSSSPTSARPLTPQCSPPRGPRGSPRPGTAAGLGERSPWGARPPRSQPAAAHPHSRGPAPGSAGLTAEEKVRRPRAPGHRICLSCSAATAMAGDRRAGGETRRRDGAGPEVRRRGNGSALGRGLVWSVDGVSDPQVSRSPSTALFDFFKQWLL